MQHTFEKVLRASALLGALGFLGIAVLVCTSVAGRALFSAPIPGDYELVQILCAVSVALVLPYAHWNNGNVMIDIFTNKALSAKTNAWLDRAAHLIVGGIALLLCWRIAVGAKALMVTQDASMMLGVPLWIGYVPMSAAFALLAVSAFWRMCAPAATPEQGAHV
jgi:TRAP-type C4-dicarboxylate transport system permease small subunit